MRIDKHINNQGDERHPGEKKKREVEKSEKEDSDYASKDSRRCRDDESFRYILCSLSQFRAKKKA